MDSGKLGTMTFLAALAILILAVLQVAQKNNLEWRGVETDKKIEGLKKEVESLRRDIDARDKSSSADSVISRLESIERGLDGMEKVSDGIEENARRLERLQGKVETLASIRVVTSPSYYPPAGTAPVPAGTGTAEHPGIVDTGEKPKFGEDTDEDPSAAQPGGSTDATDPKPADPKPSDSAGGGSTASADPAASRSELAEFEKWKSGLVGRKLANDEIERLWRVWPDGSIRPIVPLDTVGYDPAKDGGTIHRRLTTDPKGFNPLTENSSDVSDIQALCMSGLCARRLSDPNVWEFDLATSCEITDDYKVYTFKIRKGVRWHLPSVDVNDPRYSWIKNADREVTAEDFKFYMDMILNPQVECEHGRIYFQEVESSEALDRYTFRVTWKVKTYNSLDSTLGLTPLPKFLYGADEHGEPFPQETIGKDFNEHWYNNMLIGCGMYRFVEWRESQFIRVDRNPEYYGRKPNIATVLFLIVRDEESALLKLRSDNPLEKLDCMSITRIQHRKHFTEPKESGGSPLFYRRGEQPSGGANLVIDYYTQLGYNYIGWNLEKPMFSDKRVRTAMTCAFPRRKVLADVYEGLGDIVTGNFYLHGADYNKSLVPHEYDLDEARRLLTEAGWADADDNGVLERTTDAGVTEFRFNLYTHANSAHYLNLCNIFKESLRKIGVMMDVMPLEWSLMQQKMENREFDAYTGGWALSWSSDPWQIWHSKMADTPKSSNFVSFRNAECDSIIEKARVTFNPQERARLFHRFHEIIYDEQPYTFLFCSKVIPAWRPNVHPEFYVVRPQDTSAKWFIDK